MDRKSEELTIDLLILAGWIAVVAAWIVIASACYAWVGDTDTEPPPLALILAAAYLPAFVQVNAAVASLRYRADGDQDVPEPWTVRRMAIRAYYIAGFLMFFRALGYLLWGVDAAVKPVDPSQFEAFAWIFVFVYPASVVLPIALEMAQSQRRRRSPDD